MSDLSFCTRVITSFRIIVGPPKTFFAVDLFTGFPLAQVLRCTASLLCHYTLDICISVDIIPVEADQFMKKQPISFCVAKLLVRNIKEILNNTDISQYSNSFSKLLI